MTKSMNKSVNKSVRKTILKEESEEKPKQDKNKEIFQNSQRKNTPGWGEHKKNVFSNNLTEISKDDDDGAFNFRKIGSTPLGKQNKSKWNNEINNLLD